jgi:hypothetical protein
MIYIKAGAFAPAFFWPPAAGGRGKGNPLKRSFLSPFSRTPIPLSFLNFLGAFGRGVRTRRDGEKNEENNILKRMSIDLGREWVNPACTGRPAA